MSFEQDDNAYMKEQCIMDFFSSNKAVLILYMLPKKNLLFSALRRQQCAEKARRVQGKDQHK